MHRHFCLTTLFLDSKVTKQQKGGGDGGGDTYIGVSIVPHSASLTDDASQPNPVQAATGDTVTWSNDDSQPHSVTSGVNGEPDGRFDSGIMAPGATFDFTFTETGEYPYFCLLHPNQVGTIMVATLANFTAPTDIGSTDGR
jgi:plastocyanin